MKKIKCVWLISCLLFSACQALPEQVFEQPETAYVQVTEQGVTLLLTDQLEAAISRLPQNALSEAEKESLLFVAEEEKLMKALYQALNQKWDHAIFKETEKSEAGHIEIMNALLNKYGVQSPCTCGRDDEFFNPAIQRVYNEMKDKGFENLESAFRTSVELEEIDISDLQAQLSATTKADIRLVYQNLLLGSRNHLRAFMQLLKAEGGDYTPKHLNAETFKQIINTDFENPTTV